MNQRATWPKVLFWLGLPIAVLGVSMLNSSPAVGSHIVALGFVLLMGFGFGGDAWLVRVPVALIFAVVFLAAGIYGIEDVLTLSLIALAIAVLAFLLWYAIYRTWLGYGLVFLVMCVVAAERAVAFGFSWWLGALAWILANLVGLVFYGIFSAGGPERLSTTDRSDDRQGSPR